MCGNFAKQTRGGGETGEQGTGIRWGSPTPACCQGRRLNVKHRCGWEEEEKHKVQPTAHLGSTCWKISNPLRSEIDLFRKKIKTLDMNQEVSDSCINDKHMKSRWSGSKGTRIVFWAHHDLWPPTALSKQKKYPGRKCCQGSFTNILHNSNYK